MLAKYNSKTTSLLVPCTNIHFPSESCLKAAFGPLQALQLFLPLARLLLLRSLTAPNPPRKERSWTILPFLREKFPLFRFQKNWKKNTTTTLLLDRLLRLSNAKKRCAYDVTSQVLREDRLQNNRRLLQCRLSNGGQIFSGFWLAISRLISLLLF